MQNSQIAEKLLDAHVAHEMRLFESANLRASVTGELENLYDWIGGMKVREVIPNNVADLIIAELKAVPVTKETHAFVDRASKDLLAVALASEDTVAGLISPEIRDQWVEVLIASSNLRDDLSRDFVRSLFFKRLIAEILFFSLR